MFGSLALTDFNIFWGISSTIYVYTYYIYICIWWFYLMEFGGHPPTKNKKHWVLDGFGGCHQQKWGDLPTKMGIQWDIYNRILYRTLYIANRIPFWTTRNPYFFFTFLVSDHLLLKTTLFCAKQPKRAKRPKPHFLRQGGLRSRYLAWCNDRN
jgi:hypothetical protein